MKTKIMTLKIWIAAALLLSGKTFSQDCQAAVFAKKGTVIESTEYTSAKEIVSVSTTNVTSARIDNGAVLSTLHFIKKQNDGVAAEDKMINYKCNAANVEWGLGANDKNTQKEAVLLYPKNMTDGQKFNNIIMEVSKEENGKKVKMTMTYSDRKVVSTETIKVKAGSWKCSKITYNLALKIKLGFIGLPINMKMTEWYNPEVGVVRSEAYLQGKLATYTEITSIKPGR